MDIDADDVKMIVLDGIVIAPMVNYIQNFEMKIDTNFFFQALCIYQMHQRLKKCKRRSILCRTWNILWK